MIISFIIEKIRAFKRFQENRYFKSKKSALERASKYRIIRQASIRQEMEKQIRKMKNAGKTDEAIYSYLVANFSEKCSNIQSMFRYSEGKVIVY